MKKQRRKGQLLLFSFILGLLPVGCSKMKYQNTLDESQMPLSDYALKERVRSKLAEDSELKAIDLNITADAYNNSVEIAGTVDSEGQREKVIEEAKGAYPGLTVIDQLEVEPRELARAEYTEENATDEREKAKEHEEALGRSMEDAWLHAKIVAKLIGDANTPERNVNVDVVKGVVTLRGTVADNLERSEANRLARETDGVITVIDKMTVRPREKKM